MITVRPRPPISLNSLKAIQRSSNPYLIHHHTFPTSTHQNAPPPSTLSTVHLGTAYEHLCALTLPHLGFKNLTRTGGRSDRGIDLLAHWVLPSLGPANTNTPTTLRAIIQCKALTRKPGPEMVRELEGALANAPGEWRDEGTVGVLCAKREATEGVRQAVRRSGRGLVWVMAEDVLGGGEEKGRVKQVVWNERVGRMMGGKVGAGVRYVRGENGMEKEVCLMIDGRVWEPGIFEGT
ncbi:hypothetical protein ACLMJK_001801 [Lecanora helva]